MNEQFSESTNPPKSEAPKPTPTSRRCPHVDAEAIFRIAQGELNLNRAIEPVTEPLPIKVPVAQESAGSSQARGPLQPNRRQFDAADIFTLSRSAHAWQAAPIEKPSEAPEGCEQSPASMAG